MKQTLFTLNWLRKNWLKTLGLLGVLAGFMFQVPFEFGATQTISFNQEIYLPIVQKPRGPSLSTKSTFYVEAVSDVVQAVEATGQRVQLRVSRTGDLDSAVLKLNLSGSDNGALSSASATDYTFETSDGTPITDQLTFAQGQTTQDIWLEPVVDELLEVPERLRFELIEDPDYQINPTRRRINLQILDNEPGIDSDSLLLIAQMHAEDMVDTDASGLAALRLSNDNSYAMLDMDFSGLTSEETAAHIHVATPINGPIVYSVSMGQVNGDRWDIEASNHLVTNQDTLDALLTGVLYINVHSATNPGGEIRGTFAPVEGGIAMATPPAADPIAVLTGADLERDIARFLSQATFGPTPDSIADMKTRVAAHGGDRIAAYTEWIDEQVALDYPSTLAYATAQVQMYMATNDNNHNWAARNSGFEPAWFTGAVYGNAELRERTAFALSEILVISQQDNFLNDNYWLTGSYYDTLKDGAFGSYEDLLTDVSIHPAMANYLSHIRNSVETRDSEGNVTSSPDENYAREVMQLFSIGLVQLHPDGSIKLSSEGLPIPTYSQTDITELARVFTGWAYGVTTPDNGITNTTIENTNFNFWGYSKDGQAYYHPHWLQPLTMFEDNGLLPTQGGYRRYHDNGQKTVLGQTIPAGQTGEEDLAQVMTMLAQHENAAPFISYRLIQRLTSANPSTGYIFRVSQVYTATNGNLEAVVKAILLDPEARNLDHLDRVGQGKLSEPLIRFVATLRMMRATSQHHTDYQLATLNSFGLPASENALYAADTSLMTMSEYALISGDGFNQSPLNAPSVFNWYAPDYVPAGAVAEAGLVAPEMQMATENNVINLYNTFQNLVLWNGIWGQRPQHGVSSTQILIPTASWFHDVYIDVMDSNNDGEITDADEAFDSPETIRNATAALVDEMDLYLCSGTLNANATGDSLTDPREIIIDAVYNAHYWRDNNTTATAQQAVDKRVRETILILGTAPQCLLQH